MSLVKRGACLCHTKSVIVLMLFMSPVYCGTV
jgi:hypothetical protein